MIILTIKTDQPTAEIGLFDSSKKIDYLTWVADRDLSVSLLGKIQDLLKNNQLDFNQVEGIVGFVGPGSFTGLRIGLTVANTLSYGLNIPIVGATSPDWISSGVKDLLNGLNQKIILPEYDREPNITKPKK